VKFIISSLSSPQLQTTEHEMIPAEGLVWRGVGAPDCCGSVGRLFLGATDCSTTPQAENIRHFK